MNRKLDPDNRFDRAYLEFTGRTPDRTPDRTPSRVSEDRFACLRSDYHEPRRTPVQEDRFACLRDNFQAPPIRSEPRFESLREPERTEIRSPVRDPVRSPVREETSATVRPYETLLRPAVSRPPGLPSPRKKPIVQSEEQFPSLPTSPSGPKTPRTPQTPKTPKWIAEPLREELEFIPLPKPEPQCVSMSIKNGYSISLKHGLNEEEPEQMYKVVRKISGGSWSDRVKYCASAETAKDAELNYDEDGFPMIHGIEDMVNSFS